MGIDHLEPVGVSPAAERGDRVQRHQPGLRVRLGVHPRWRGQDRDDHRRHEQYHRLQRARPRPAQLDRPGELLPQVELVGLGQLWRHGLHGLLSDQRPEADSELGRRREPAAATPRAGRSSTPRRASTPAGPTSPSATARSGSSRTPSRPGPSTIPGPRSAQR